jgi:hypothetical protein
LRDRLVLDLLVTKIADIGAGREAENKLRIDALPIRAYCAG